jgi:hypothetical protein
MTADLKVGIATLSEKVIALDERVKKLESGTTPGQKVVTDALNRIEARLMGDTRPFAPVALTDSETRAIGEFLDTKGPRKGPAEFGLGDPVPESQLKPIPDALGARVPKLRGAKYTYIATVT